MFSVYTLPAPANNDPIIGFTTSYWPDLTSVVMISHSLGHQTHVLQSSCLYFSALLRHRAKSNTKGCSDERPSARLIAGGSAKLLRPPLYLLLLRLQMSQMFSRFDYTVMASPFISSGWSQ